MISVTVITKNEEANIGRCLASVGWADEIIVVDAESSDRTAEIARRSGAKVIVKPWEGFSQQKEFAFHQATKDWIFSIDADEEVTEPLKEEILRTVQRADALNGYEIPRKSFFLGKWIRHGGWYPGYQLRLFKKAAARMNHRPVHEGFLTEGPVGRLNADLNHYTYASLHHYLEKMNDYSSLDVMNKLSGGRRIRWYNIFLNPLAAFLRIYVSLGGFKEGVYGFLLAYYSSLHSLALYAKCWEYQTASERGAALPPVSAAELHRLEQS